MRRHQKSDIFKLICANTNTVEMVKYAKTALDTNIHSNMDTIVQYCNLLSLCVAILYKCNLGLIIKATIMTISNVEAAHCPCSM